MTEPTQVEHTGAAQHELEHTVLSTASLFKATVFAGLLATVVLITAILPAEYGIDPTGMGEAMGLMPLANAVTPVEVTKAAQDPASAQDPTLKNNSVKIIIPAESGLEYKFQLEKGEAMRYDWSSTGGQLYFDFHGEPEGDTSGYFESYTESTAQSAKGSFTASFAGSHGWYWKNESEFPVVVSLQTEGNYKVIGVK